MFVLYTRIYIFRLDYSYKYAYLLFSGFEWNKNKKLILIAISVTYDIEKQIIVDECEYSKEK